MYSLLNLSALCQASLAGSGLWLSLALLKNLCGASKVSFDVEGLSLLWQNLARPGSVRAREIGKLARKHRNRHSLQQVYEIVRDIW
jgi:hypothetical protein